MIVTVREYDNNIGMLNAYAGLLGGAANLLGDSVYILPLTNVPKRSTVSLLVGHEEHNAASDNKMYRSGVDAFFNMLSAGKVPSPEEIHSKSDFMVKDDETGKYPNRFDVADASGKEDFISSLSTSSGKNIVKAFLDILRSKYQFIIIILEDKTDEGIFGEDCEDVTSMFDRNIMFVRQGTWMCRKSSDAYIVRPEDLIVISEFSKESKYGAAKMKSRLNLPKKSQMYTLASNVPLLDAIHSGNIMNFIREAGDLHSKDFVNPGRTVIHDCFDIVDGLTKKHNDPLDTYGEFEKIQHKTVKQSYFKKNPVIKKMSYRDPEREHIARERSVLQQQSEQIKIYNVENIEDDTDTEPLSIVDEKTVLSTIADSQNETDEEEKRKNKHLFSFGAKKQDVRTSETVTVEEPAVHQVKRVIRKKAVKEESVPE